MGRTVETATLIIGLIYFAWTSGSQYAILALGLSSLGGAAAQWRYDRRDKWGPLVDIPIPIAMLVLGVGACYGRPNPMTVDAAIALTLMGVAGMIIRGVRRSHRDGRDAATQE